MAVLQTLGSQNLLHYFVTIIFGFLIICMFIRFILSWLPMLPPGNPFVRFFTLITGPFYDPIYRVLPRMSVSVLDLRASIAFLFSWWALTALSALLVTAIPYGW